MTRPFSRFAATATAGVIAALLLAGTAAAEGLKAGGSLQVPSAARIEQPARDGMSLREAVERAKRSFPGRVLRAETQQKGNRREHVVRILNDEGRVRTLKYDADSGRRL